MDRSLVVAFVVASFMGCEKQNTPARKADAPVAEKAQTDEKTIDDARKYMQEQIDRYLGGQRTPEQLMKLTLEGARLSIGNRINSISITNVLQAYGKKGEKWPNAFKVSMLFGGEGLAENVESNVMYDPKTGWMAF